MIPYRLLIALAAGLVAAIVFASATTGPLLVQMILLLLTPLALFLAGLGLGPTAAVVAGIAGTSLVLIAGTPVGALIFAVSQALPVIVLVYLASLSRQGPNGTTEYYPVGRLVIAAALMSAAFAALALILLGGDLEPLRNALREMLKAFAASELSNMPDAPKLGPAEIDEAANLVVVLWPAGSAISSMSSLLFNLWLAGRITLASSRLHQPWPDIAAMLYPPVAPLMLAVFTGLSFLDDLIGMMARAFAGTLFFAYVLLGLAVVHYVTRGRPWRAFALWGLYALLFLTNSIGLLGIALLGLAEAIWPMRTPPTPPPNDRPPS